ncbi:hypothetical protein D3C80_565480 [compost metagenome]
MVSNAIATVEGACDGEGHPRVNKAADRQIFMSGEINGAAYVRHFLKSKALNNNVFDRQIVRHDVSLLRTSFYTHGERCARRGIANLAHLLPMERRMYGCFVALHYTGH